MLVRVTLYTKPGCHLCEDVDLALDRVRERVPFDLIRINILGNKALEARYGFEIPVVIVNDQEFSSTFLNEIKFEKYIKEIAA
jgi:glutaredoxin